MNTEIEINDQPRWHAHCGRWSDDCECQFCENCESLVEPPRESGLCERCEATSEWYDELSAKSRNNTGGEAHDDGCACVHASSPVPLQLDYPVWRLSFSAYAQHMGWEIPAMTTTRNDR